MGQIHSFVYSIAALWIEWSIPGGFSDTPTPNPTLTPVSEAPMNNPGITNMMLIFGLMIVIVILFGIVINRRRIFK
jgi:hypothetical protein